MINSALSCYRTESTSVQAMDCRLSGAKPEHETMLILLSIEIKRKETKYSETSVNKARIL